MIQAPEVSQVVAKALPELKNEVSSSSCCNNPYECLHVLSDYTRHAVETANEEAVKKSFEVANQLYADGDAPVKRAVENVFVYSLSHSLPHSPDRRARLMNQIPPALRHIYHGQVCSVTGC